MITPEEWDAAYAAAEPSLPEAEVEPHPELLRWVSGRTPGRAADLGCGEGWPAIWLASRGWRVTAVDFSAVAIERGRRVAGHAGAEVDWVVADLGAYAPEAGLDLAVLLYFHGDWRGVLRRAADALAPGGMIFALGWDRSNAGRRGPGPAEVLYDLGEMTAAVSDLEVRHAATVPQEPGGAALDAVFVATRPA